MTEILEKKVHVWEGLKEYKLTPREEGDIREGYFDKIGIEILKKLEVNEYFPISEINCLSKKVDIRDTTKFQRVIKQLNEMGFDIGRGNAKYGYKMPLPKKEETGRELIIFRRW